MGHYQWRRYAPNMRGPSPSSRPMVKVRLHKFATGLKIGTKEPQFRDGHVLGVHLWVGSGWVDVFHVFFTLRWVELDSVLCYYYFFSLVINDPEGFWKKN